VNRQQEWRSLGYKTSGQSWASVLLLASKAETKNFTQTNQRFSLAVCHIVMILMATAALILITSISARQGAHIFVICGEYGNVTQVTTAYQ